jgi:tRNA-specific 2-thiouridylase
MPIKAKKVFVAMSGGVDSSVAAFLLQRDGYDVTGVFMKCFNVDGCAERDAEDARRVANQLKIPFYVFDFEKEYKKEVVKYMVDGYRKGITPNPDVMCNKEIKFGLFLKKSLKLGADYIATGHYIRLSCSPDAPAQGVSGASPWSYPSREHRFSLLIARDSNKDQSYFLWTLTQEQLKYCLFPVGDLLKPELRAIAKKAKLPTAEKKDSQGICFLGQVTLEDFLKAYIKPKRGNIVTADGKKIGEHHGAQFYTIGQRHGLNVGGGTPYYVISKDVKTNTLVVAKGSDDPALYGKEIGIGKIHFIGETPKLPARVMARVRYRQPVSPAVLSKNKLSFEKPQKFIAAGQSAVFYSIDGEMLGGGIIR